MITTIIVSLIVGTITALAVQCWMNRVVDRIEQLEFRVNDIAWNEHLRGGERHE